MKDKEIEKNRYNLVSKENIELPQSNSFFKLIGSKAFPVYFRQPYIAYEKLLENLIFNNKNVKTLDLCCGDGIHSFSAAIFGADVIALDYAENSILLAKKRAESLGIKVDFMTCDVEKLPFENEKFDIVTCIGSLSYLNHDILIKEVIRVLKFNGKFIVIDSFNYNPIYRLNRYIHFLKGNRTYSTLERMPNNKLLEKIKVNFSEFNIEYFGTFIFLIPFFKLFLNEQSINRILIFMDNFFNIFKRYSFKILFIATK